MNKFFCFTGLILVLLLTGISCGNKEAAGTPDVSAIQIPYTAHAFYKDYAAIDPAHMAAGLERMKTKYPEFLDFYLDTLNAFGFGATYTDTNRMFYDFLTMKDFRALLDTVNLAFPDTKKYDEQLQQTFRYIRHYDSSFALPRDIYYFVSYLRGPNVAWQSDKNMAIALDMFMGEDFFPYRQLNKSAFETIRMTPDNIPVWVARIIYEDKYPFSPEDKNMLELMVEKGKELYFIEKAAPYLKEEVKFGFSPEQLAWCRKNEALIYNFFLQQNLLFERNLQKTMRYLSDGPTSPGMPAESPGNSASFIGWSIVKQYAERNQVPMPVLLETKDARKILEGARYKP